ncbi:uncharacterized protein I303_100056 [Kwoniella dejecticola CBS 10117]|uniref:Uncharacterized protein n=1 Tax=Kwoniella dejecticola CBS 10117 TaxID=1296121 RepID=A0A1A6ADV6_9TREE|nr:uncharacterized protein I303_00056 [Kwoniella dejecticola CBS 10117]OBR88245.1 hypothetical protein I303_00056 [Kwoniella dejecticola CBS 10117]
MFSTQIIFIILASMTVATTAKPIAPNYPEPVFVLKPDNSTMDQFREDFLVLCPQYYGDSEITDQPIFIFETFQERFEKDIWHGRKAAVQCIYQLPTAEYQNIGVDVARALGGDGLIFIDPIEGGPLAGGDADTQ